MEDGGRDRRGHRGADAGDRLRCAGSSTKYLITTQRLRISRGIVSKNVQETRLERVQNVNYEQGVLDRLLGVGTVDFDTAGTDDSEFRFEWVNDPEQVVRAVDQAVEEARAAAQTPRLRSRRCPRRASSADGDQSVGSATR